MNKEFIPVNCTATGCPHFDTCCQVPTEVIRHDGREGIDLMIFGMGAGEDEAKQKRCFVGVSGRYMRSIIKYLWENEDVGPFNLAISNNVRCHPMDSAHKNREPTEIELNHCKGYLERDIIQLQPKAILPVGRCATETFLKTAETSITALRKKSYKVKIGDKEFGYFPTYHPSFLIRTYGKFEAEKNNQYDSAFISDILKALDLT